MKKAILPQSDVGKTKEEIRRNFNSYPVMTERKTPQPVRREMLKSHMQFILSCASTS
jgi:hypothetical protein